MTFPMSVLSRLALLLALIVATVPAEAARPIHMSPATTGQSLPARATARS